MTRFRVFVSSDKAGDLPPDVVIEEVYDSFAIVSASEEAITDIRERYPVEPLEPLEPAEPWSEPALPQPFAADLDIAPRRGPHTVKVRFRAPVREGWISELEDAGYTVHALLGGSEVVVAVRRKAALVKLASHPEVVSVTAYVPQVEISAGFMDGLVPAVDNEDAFAEPAAWFDEIEEGEAERGLTFPGHVWASFFSEEEAQLAQRALSRAGIRRIMQVGKKRLLIDLTGVQDPLVALQTIMARRGLRSLEEKHIYHISNDVARVIIGDRVVDGGAHSLGLTGKGEVVAVADTGLDTGEATTVHVDFRGRVRDIQDFPICNSHWSFVSNLGHGDGAEDLYSGHGTHVCGSVLGSGARAEALGLKPIRGVAPEAELVFQAVEQTPEWNAKGWQFFFPKQPPHHGLFGLPDDLKELLLAAYDQGARIHSNSWGGGVPGQYNAYCEDLDEFVWEHRDCLVVVAAGNEGADSKPPESGIALTSIDSPAIAKNCLAVGASESKRPGFADTYGQQSPEAFPREPFKSDHVADSVDDIVAWSSRGPCATGRLKPDVVAPGTYILSNRSSRMPSGESLWAPFPPAPDDYVYDGGTSMATPLVAGAAALVRQYLRQEIGLANPSAAVLKAALIHSAQYRPYRYAHPLSSPWADHEQGWGRVELWRVLNSHPPTTVLFIDNVVGLRPEKSAWYTVNVGASSAPLRCTLVYTDWPGEKLVNRLNLFAFSPGGRYFVGNDFKGTRVPDATNNVEGIVVEKPQAGGWRLQVVASEVMTGFQDFALVISGAGVSLATHE